MITNRRSQEKFNSKNGINRPPLYDLSVYCGGLSWRKLNMGKLKNLLGQKFGKWTVIKRLENDKFKRANWLCKCDCGKERKVIGSDLLSGKSTSCGCSRRKEKTIEEMSRDRIRRIWTAMRQRCENPNSTAYKNYGGRGITVCQEWQEFIPFYNWAIVNGYNDTLTIERIDVNNIYCPNNCTWISKSEQGENTRKVNKLTYKGETHSLRQWGKITKLSVNTIKDRLDKGYTIEQALEKKGLQKKYIKYKGQTKTIAEWARELNIKRVTIESRLRTGWSVKRTFETPVKQKMKIKCVELNKVYKNIKEAAKDLNLKKTCSISKCLTKNTETAYGYHWEYITGES